MLGGLVISLIPQVEVETMEEEAVVAMKAMQEVRAAFAEEAAVVGSSQIPMVFQLYLVELEEREVLVAAAAAGEDQSQPERPQVLEEQADSEEEQEEQGDFFRHLFLRRLLQVAAAVEELVLVEPFLFEMGVS